MGIVNRTLDIAVMLVSNLQNRRDTTYETLVYSRRRLCCRSSIRCSAPAPDARRHCERPYIMLTVDEAGKTAERYWSLPASPANDHPHLLGRKPCAAWVAAGMGVTILSDMVYRPWSSTASASSCGPVAANIPSMDVGLVWNKKTRAFSRDKLFREFFSLNFSGATH